MPWNFAGRLRFAIFSAILLAGLFRPQQAEATTHVFSSPILASNHPFETIQFVPDTIIIRDSFSIDINYEPIMKDGNPFGGVNQGVLILDGYKAVIDWTSAAYFKLGYYGRIVLIHGGHFRPSGNSPDCNSLKTLYFDSNKLASCTGLNAPHAFTDVNTAGCITVTGICCNVYMTETDHSGNPNDLILCSPGDTANLSVISSGTLSFTYLWYPNLGVGPGPFSVAPTNSTNYSVSLTAIFDPYGPEPAYLLSCDGNVTVQINSHISLSTATTPVPCAAALTGGVLLNVSGGTAPYRYLWSNGQTTKNITNLAKGDYTVTVTDRAGCTGMIKATVGILDNTPPTLSCPSNVVDTAQINICSKKIANINAVYSDNCPSPDLTYQLSGATTGNGIGQLTNTVPFNAGITTAKYLVSDGSNTVSCTFTVTVRDIQYPTASNPASISGIQCSSQIPTPDPTLVTDEHDNCAVPTVTFLKDSVGNGGGCPSSVRTVYRYYRVTDVFGNAINVMQTLLVSDTQAPVFTAVPPNVTVNCQTIPSVGTATGTDNCGGAITITYNGETKVSGACPDSYTLKRKWTAVDHCGNSATTEQILTVQDTIKPVFTFVPANITVNCDAVPASGTPTASDNCAPVATIVFNGETRVNGSCPDTYTLQRTWTASDRCGNTQTAVQTLTVRDVTKPVFTFVPANATVSCDAIPAVGTPVATDNCSATVAISFDGETRVNGSCPDTYTLQRRWTASDNCGNAQTALQTLTVQDITKPVFTFVPVDITVNCDAVPATNTPSATDNCDAAVTITFDGETRTNGSCPDSYILQRQWTASDNCGNTQVAVQKITVRDITKPVFTSVPANVTVNCDAIPAAGAPTATDNCDAAVAITYNGETKTNGSCTSNYTLRRKWTASDNCGNTQTAEQILTVQDTTRPVFVLVPPAVTVSCDAVPAPGTPTATDNCSAGVSITYNGEVRTNGSCPDSYTLIRTWTAQDNCGNTRTATQALTVQDITRPVFTFIPAAITVNCDAIPSVGAPAATDNCDASVTITYSGETRTNGACQDSYTLLRSWTAQDNCGNTRTATQSITVQDTTRPVFTFVPPAITVNCDAIPTAGTPTATDNCDASVAIAYNGETRTDGACSGNYTLRRQWTAMDNCGNSRTAQQLLTVQDTTRPSFTFIPPAITVNCDDIPAAGTPVAQDNCDPNVHITFLGETRTDGSCVNKFTLKRTWSAVDNCGNIRTALQIVSVQDTTRPVFTFVPHDTLINCADVPAPGTPVAKDNCAEKVTIVYNGEVKTPGPCPNSYVLTRKWTGTDNCGNARTARQVLTVQDTVRPVFSFVPPDITVSCDAIPTVGTPTAIDNCSPTVDLAYKGEIRTNGSCPGNYTLRRTWTAADQCGNIRSTAQIITVQDITKPVFTFTPAPVTVNCNAIPAPGSPTATDNCDPSVLIGFIGETRTDGSCPDNYFLHRTWSAMDNCGNSTTTEQILTVQDTTKPVFTFIPPAITVNCDAIPAPGQPKATDNCDAQPEITYNGQTRTNGACPNSYTLRREWTATDNCGNTTTATQLLTVQDTTKPVFTFVPQAITVNCDAIPGPGAPQATDNCSANVVITYNGEIRTNGNCPGNYILHRIWTAADECGNTSTTSQAVSVQDTTKPVFTFIPPAVTVSCDAIPAPGTPTATDNCTASVTITYNGESRINGACPSSYFLHRTWTASDNCGNTSTATQVIAVRDITKPVFTFVPAAATVNCDAIPAPGNPTASDNCDNAVLITYNGESRTNGACPNSYFLRREWSAQDNCGNATTAEQLLTVQDTTRPVFTFIPPAATVNCDAIPTPGIPKATDNCDLVVAITYDGQTRINGACPDSYMLRRQWTAADNCGNTTTATQLLTVQDTTKPVFTFIPPATVVNCDAIPAAATPKATDNCATDVSITYNGEVKINGNCPGNYFLHRRWTAMDACGNTNTAVQVMTVQDTTRPVFTFVPPAITVNCDAVPAPGAPSATDNCSANVAITYSGEAKINGHCPSSYVLRRHWIATDDCGNTQTALQVLTVQDTTKPVFAFIPPDVTVNCDALPNPGVPTALDNCTTSPVITYDGEVIMSASSASTYILRRKWTVIDNCDNKAVAVQYLSVRDTVPPAIACPANIAVNADGAICGAVVPYSAPVTSDNCSTTLVVTSTAASGSTFPIGTTTVILNAKDDSGNTSTCSFRVMVADTTHPVLHNCPPNLTFTSPDSDCNAVGSWNTPSVTDHCDQYAIAALPSIASGSTFPTGFTTVMYSATDSTGNKTTCSFVVTVNETIAPELHNCPTDITVTTDTCTAKASWTPPTATDNCKLDTMTVNIASGSVFPEGPSTVVYKAIDAWGNTTTCSFKVTVKDLIHPTFSGCPKDTVVNSNGACTAPVSWAQPVATDNCGPNPLVFSIPASGSVFPVGYKYVHVYAQDGSGNQDTCVFKVTVIGPPLGFTNIPDNQQHIGCSAVVTWLPPVPTGVCGPVTITATNNPGDNFEIGVTVVTYTVTDTLGNSATASFKITVTESVPPVFNCPDSPPVEVNNAAVVVNDPDHFVMKTDTISSCDGAKLNFNLPQATDNCGTPTVTQIAGLSSGSVFKTGMHTLQFLAKDKAGNTSLCSVIIKVTTMKPLDPKISDAIGCPGTEITISTPVIPGAHYFWTGPIPGGYTDDNNLIIPKLNDNLTGIYTVRAQLNGCYTPLDSALVRIGKVPKAVDDPGFEIEPDATLDSIDVLQNDTYFTDDYDVTLETTNLPGLTDLGQGHFRYKAPARNGRVSFIYRLCSHACPDLCSTGIATITIREVICKYIPNVITPNGDGINDWLEIPCVETGLYPQNRLIIYNQWGDKVYEAAPYSNSPDAAWKGTMNGQDGKGLPDATYFYIFKPTPESQGLKGFVEIIR